MNMVTKITRNGYANLLVSPKSKCVFPSSSSSSLLKNPFHQRSIYSTIYPSHLQKICSPNDVVSGTKGFFPNSVAGRRFFSNALWKGRTSNTRFYNSFKSLDRGRSAAAAATHPRSIFQNNANVQLKSPANFVAKRLYNSHIAKRRCWYQDPTNLITLGFIGCGVVIPVYCWNSETVPYANRGNFVLASTSFENKIGKLILERLIKSDKYKGKILDSHHPESIRVNKILQEIIGGLMRKKIQTSELYNWEIVVVDEPAIVNASSAPGGKIVIYTGMLNHFKTDAEIATVIGHEVGHVVARHYAEKMSGAVWMVVIGLQMYKTIDLYLRLPPPLANFLLTTSLIYFVSSCVFFSWFWSFSTWHETEADYIGILISASAGYDPRIAPELYQKLENHSSSHSASVWNLFNPHPHGNKRAQLLSRPKVMEEALAIYTEAHKDEDEDEDEDKDKE